MRIIRLRPRREAEHVPGEAAVGRDLGLGAPIRTASANRGSASLARSSLTIACAMPALARALDGSASAARAKKFRAGVGIAHLQRRRAGAVERADAARILGERGQVAAQFGAGAVRQRLHDRTRRQRPNGPAPAPRRDPDTPERQRQEAAAHSPHLR